MHNLFKSLTLYAQSYEKMVNGGKATTTLKLL
jgi:hypothetical protein